MQSRTGGSSQAQGLTGEMISLPSWEGVGAAAGQGRAQSPCLYREKAASTPSWDLPSRQAGGAAGQNPLLSVQPMGKLRRGAGARQGWAWCLDLGGAPWCEAAYAWRGCPVLVQALGLPSRAASYCTVCFVGFFLMFYFFYC